MHAAQRPNAMQGPQILRVGQHQLGRQQAFIQQQARAIDIGHGRIHQAGSLHRATGNLRPISGAQQHGQQLQRPRARGFVTVAKDVVAGAVFTHAVAHLRRTRIQAFGLGHAAGGKKLLPQRRRGRTALAPLAVMQRLTGQHPRVQPSQRVVSIRWRGRRRAHAHIMHAFGPGPRRR